jgi:hypothetical protein
MAPTNPKEPNKPFADLAPEIRALAISRGIIRAVAKKTGSSRSNVSETFSGKIQKPNAKIVVALKRALKELTEDAA